MFEVTKKPYASSCKRGRPGLGIPFDKLAEKDDSFVVPLSFGKYDSVKMAAWRYGKENGVKLRTNKEDGGLRITRC